MMDIIEQVNTALKKLKADLIDNDFTLDELCRRIRSETGCNVDDQGRKVIAEMLGSRRDLRPLSGEGERWCFGCYTPPSVLEKRIENAA